MAAGGFFGFAPGPRTSANAGAASIFLTHITPSQNGTVTAVLLDGNTGASAIQFKALIYDGSHSALLATGSTITTLVSGYNRLPLTSGLSVTAGTSYYVGYVCNASCAVGTQSTGSLSWFVSGGQNVTTPANPLVGGVSNAAVLMCAAELDGTGVADFGWGPDYASGVALSVSNTVATFSSASSLGVRGLVSQVNGTGKWYAEIDVGGTINNAAAVGIASVNWGVTQAVSGVPTSAYSGFLYPTGLRNGNVTLSSMTYASGDTVGIAYNAVSNLMWWNKNNGTWWGVSASSGDPVAGTNGYAVNASQWPMTPAAMTASGTAATFTLRDYASTLRYTPPTGYTAWASPSVGPVSSTQVRAMVLA